jgi:hypothetical protein
MSVEDLLETYLADPVAGRKAMERVMAENPTQASELNSLLDLVAELQVSAAGLEPRLEFTRRLGQRLRNRLSSGTDRAARPRAARPGFAFGFRPVMVLLTAVLAGAVALGSFGVVQASAAALPGDTLYPVKRGVEELRLALSWTPAEDAHLLGVFADERLEEIEVLASAGRMDDLETALDSYTNAVGRLARAVGVPAAGGTDEVLDKLTHHIAVLEEVRSRVPAPAQAAIERVIERSIDAETKGRPELPTPAPDGRPCAADPANCPPAPGGADHDERMADQISRIYGVPIEQVMALYQGECQGDWKCVRTHVRESQHPAPSNPHRP